MKIFHRKRNRDYTAGLRLISRVGQAIASKGNVGEPGGTAQPRPDRNPYTAELSAYDLARLISFLEVYYLPKHFCLSEHVVACMLSTITRTNNSSRADDPTIEVARLRALWLQHEFQENGIVLQGNDARVLDDALHRVTRRVGGN